MKKLDKLSKQKNKNNNNYVGLKNGKITFPNLNETVNSNSNTSENNNGNNNNTEIEKDEYEWVMVEEKEVEIAPQIKYTLPEAPLVKRKRVYNRKHKLNFSGSSIIGSLVYYTPYTCYFYPNLDILYSDIKLVLFM